MPRDFLPIIYQDDGTYYRTSDTTNRGDARAVDALYNCVPWLLQNGEIGACPRSSFLSAANVPASSTDRGRGITVFAGETNLYLDETNYYYNGGNTDLTNTSSPGYAGNTGFNEEYTGSFVRHNVSGVENLVIVNAGHTSTHASAKHGNIWYVADGTTAPSSISDADIPCNNGVSITRGGASLDGYFFVCDITGKIYNSDLNDITAWTSTNFLTAERNPDTGVYLGRHHDNLVYIGTKSIEFFYNAGNATGSPLSRRQDISYSVGCYLPNTIIEVGDAIYFVGTESGTGQMKVYRLQNFQLSEVSNAKINEKLRGLQADYPDITTLDALEHQCWMSFSTANDSPGLILTYDIQWTYYCHLPSGVWAAWERGQAQSYAGGTTSTNWSRCFPVIDHNGTSGITTVSRYQLTDGRIIYEDAPSNGGLIDWSVGTTPLFFFMQFAKWDGGTDKKKRINWVRIITEPPSDSDSSYSPMSVDLRWFDYSKSQSGGGVAPNTNYSTARSVDLSKRGARVARCGTTRERSFILDWTTGNGPVTVVKGLEIEYDIVE